MIQCKKIVGAAILGLSFMCSANAASNAGAKDLDWGDCTNMYLYLSGKTDYASMVDEYMKDFYNETYDRYHNDEFEMDGQRKKTIEKMKAAVQAVNPDVVYQLRVRFYFGKYDFNKNVYPVVADNGNFNLENFPAKAFMDNSYYEIDRGHYGFYSENNREFPVSYKLSFSNPEVMQPLHMDVNAAKAFLKRHTNTMEPDRRIYGKVKYKIKSIDDQGQVSAELVGVEYFHDNNMTKLIESQDFTKPAEKS